MLTAMEYKEPKRWRRILCALGWHRYVNKVIYYSIDLGVWSRVCPDCGHDTRHDR